LSGIGFWELVVLFVIGLLILGPERLPRVATQIGRWVGRARRTANQLRYQIEREIALADIEKKSNKPDETKRESDSSAQSRAAEPDQNEAEAGADGKGAQSPRTDEAPASGVTEKESGQSDESVPPPNDRDSAERNST
jgi:sec-independent protein translocase protein TatB